MSHTTILEFQVKDWQLLQDTCKAVGAKCTIGELKLKLFSSQTYDVRARIKLPDWGYEIGVSADGNLYYDHFGSQRDTMKHLTKLRNEYTLRVSEKVAKKQKRRCRRILKSDRPEWQFVEVYV